MNWLDFVLLIIICSSAISGLWHGFARTVVGTLAAVFAVLAAIWFYGSAASLLSDYVSHPTVANFLGFVIVFSIVMLGGVAVGWLLGKAFKWAGLGWLDRLLGGGVGVLRGALVATGLVLLLCSFTRSPPPPSVVNSRVAPYMIEVANVVSYLAPRELKDGFQASYEKAKKIWREVLQTIPGTL